MKVGDYVRTIQGYIAKIESIKDGIYMCDNTIGYVYEPFASFSEANKEVVVKSSPNIIDLIEVGDYVNGELVQDIIRYEDDEFIHTGFEHYRKEEIKSIVTKEQFSSMEYKINE